MEHIYLVAYLIDGMHDHARIYANNKHHAVKIFKESMGARYTITEVEEVI